MIKWLIQNDVFGIDEELELTLAVGWCGCQYRSFGSYQDLLKFDLSNAIIRCSLEVASFLRNKDCFLWCDFPKFRCNEYYPYYNRYLLNQDYDIMTAQDIICNKKYIRDQYVKNNKIFIKQNSGTKSFLAGDLIKFDDIDNLLKECLKDNRLFLLSTPKEIDQEWRLVVVDGKIVSGCQYLPYEDNNCPNDVLNFANTVIGNRWQPEDIYTLDICLSKNRFWVLEINSFSCAGLYANNMYKIVKSTTSYVKKC